MDDINRFGRTYRVMATLLAAISILSFLFWLGEFGGIISPLEVSPPDDISHSDTPNSASRSMLTSLIFSIITAWGTIAATALGFLNYRSGNRKLELELKKLNLEITTLKESSAAKLSDRKEVDL